MSSEKKIGFMRTAVAEARAGVAADHGGPFGAVIVRQADAEVIASGHNMVIANKDPTAHAEVTAIRAACTKLNVFSLAGYVLYTSCYPCPMCLGAALWAGLDTIYFAATPADAAKSGFDDAKFYEFVRCPDEERLQQLVVDDYLVPFRDWDKKPDKEPY